MSKERRERETKQKNLVSRSKVSTFVPDPPSRSSKKTPPSTFYPNGLQIELPSKMAPWSFRKKKGHGADAVAEGEAQPGSTSANEASDKGSVKPPAIARAPSSSRHKHKPHDLVKLSRPPVSFLFALFLNQLYINLILLVPRQVGIYIIRTRFLPQDNPAAQLTGERGEEEVSSFFRGRPRGG